jgi:hypothetical protein
MRLAVLAECGKAIDAPEDEKAFAVTRSRMEWNGRLKTIAAMRRQLAMFPNL